MNPEINAPLASAPAPVAASKPAVPVPSTVTPVPANTAKVRPPRQGKKPAGFAATAKSS